MYSLSWYDHKQTNVYINMTFFHVQCPCLLYVVLTGTWLQAYKHLGANQPQNNLASQDKLQGVTGQNKQAHEWHAVQFQGYPGRPPRQSLPFQHKEQMLVLSISTPYFLLNWIYASADKQAYIHTRTTLNSLGRFLKFYKQ